MRTGSEKAFAGSRLAVAWIALRQASFQRSGGRSRLARRSAKREGVPRQPTRYRQLSADDRLDAGALRGEVKTRRAVDAVAIEQRERRIAERRGAVDQRFGQRGAVEKRKGGGSVQFDIHGAHVADALVVNPFDKPSVGIPLQKDAAYRAVVERHVPFVAVPALAVPPVAGRSATGRLPAGRHRRACRGDRWPRETGAPFSTATRTATGGRKRRRAVRPAAPSAFAWLPPSEPVNLSSVASGFSRKAA